LHSHNPVKEFEGRQKNPDGRSSGVGQRDKLEAGTMFLHFALQTLDKVVVNFSPDYFRWAVPAQMDTTLRSIRLEPVEERDEHMEVEARRSGA